MDYRLLYDHMYARGYKKDPSASMGYALLELLQRHARFASVLDVGCGNGCIVDLLQRQGIVARGVEVSAEAVALCNQLNRPCVEGNATRLPMADRSVDVVFSSDMLEHLLPEDVDAALCEFARVAARYIAIAVATVPSGDKSKCLAGCPIQVPNLHLTVQPTTWWIARVCDNTGFALLAQRSSGMWKGRHGLRSDMAHHPALLFERLPCAST